MSEEQHSSASDSIRATFVRLFRRLTVCTAQDFKEAATEVLIICISGYLPLWAGIGLMMMTTTTGAATSYADHFVNDGELLLIACALIGPLVYIVTRKYGGFAEDITLRFPYSTGFSMLILFMWFFTGMVFVGKKGKLVAPGTFADSAMWSVSITVTLAAIITVYFATAFRNSLDRVDASRMMHADQEQFVKEFGNG